MAADLLSSFLSAQRAFGERVRAIREDQWNAPTPATEWDVAALVGHLIEENRWVPPLMHGLDMESATKVVEGGRKLPVDGGVGANLAAEWEEVSVAAADAFGAPGAMERDVALSRGTTPAAAYIGEMIGDHLVHAWDLGKAIGYDPASLPSDVVELVYSQLADFGDLAATGMFAAPVEVPDDASTLDKLIALTGRDPR